METSLNSRENRTDPVNVRINFISTENGKHSNFPFIFLLMGFSTLIQFPYFSRLELPLTGSVRFSLESKVMFTQSSSVKRISKMGKKQLFSKNFTSYKCSLPPRIVSRFLITIVIIIIKYAKE